MSDGPNAHLKLITQIGLVVGNLEQAVAGMRRLFGVDPDSYGQTPKNGKKYHGEDEDFEAKLAFYRFANIEIEFIQPLRGKNIWTDFLKAGKSGLHHIRFGVDNFADTVKDMESRGARVSMEGLSVRNVPGLRWAYFDTEREVDFIVEILNNLEVGLET